ncbi:hypothetical protein UFOVP1604_44 [uncultured Caudovirales phage]|uniref:Uncharacterized protein n=1 Tax=uncultured Caudovirales phage TaxID=2100421 RepID=A0A6J5ST75_9CAUD|nr:hypothetical protein UFOVP1604_44 [uncultured Caudovirales phage]
MKEITKDERLINQTYPFLVNFPFRDEFTMEIANSPVLAAMFDDEFEPVRTSKSPTVIDFIHSASPIKSKISIFKEDLLWIDEVAGSVKKLDKISKQIDRGLKSKDLLVKRNISIETDEWLTGVADPKSALSKEVFNEVLGSLVSNQPVAKVSELVTTINKLYLKKGIIKLSQTDANLIFTFIHFRLIYAKLILGIVISSKISI